MWSSVCSTGYKPKSTETAGSDDAAQKVYVAPGKYDGFYNFVSEGFNGPVNYDGSRGNFGYLSIYRVLQAKNGLTFSLIIINFSIQNMMKFQKSTLLALSFLALLSCSGSGPKDFLLEKDQCDNCKMTVADINYATELITEKGRVYKFDDLSCMTMYESSEPEKAKNAKKYVIDAPTGKFLDLSKATLIKGGSIKSPMGGNTQAFASKEAAQKAAATFGATLIN